MPPVVTLAPGPIFAGMAFPLMFTDNADWRTSIRSVEYRSNGVTVSDPNHTSLLILQGSILVLQPLTAGTHTIEIKATGYSDVIITVTLLPLTPPAQ